MDSQDRDRVQKAAQEFKVRLAGTYDQALKSFKPQAHIAARRSMLDVVTHTCLNCGDPEIRRDRVLPACSTACDTFFLIRVKSVPLAWVGV